jgi:hypothetical protein
MENYARKLPKDKTDNVMQEFAVPFPAVRTTARDNATTSSVTAVSSITTVIEVAAIAASAAIKWVTQANLTATSSVITAAGTADFDNIIPAGTVRRFVVPRASASLSMGSVSGINVQEGLYNAVASKSTGIGSVLLTEY